MCGLSAVCLFRVKQSSTKGLIFWVLASASVCICGQIYCTILALKWSWHTQAKPQNWHNDIRLSPCKLTNTFPATVAYFNHAWAFKLFFFKRKKKRIIVTSTAQLMLLAAVRWVIWDTAVHLACSLFAPFFLMETIGGAEACSSA